MTDWGLTHCDITYDVAQVWDGAFFRLDDHLDRFEASMKTMHFSVPQDRAEITRILHRLVKATGLRHAYCAFVTSRGPQTIPGSRDPRTCKNPFYAWVVPYVHVISEEVVARGARLKIATRVERIGEKSVDPTAKNYHWGDITAGIYEAVNEGFDSVILKDADGNICEGPGFNVFAVKNGEVLTPKSGVLHGITRKTVLEICTDLGIKSTVKDISEAQFLDADEVFISSSGGGVVPIPYVNNHIFAGGNMGPVTRSLREAYFQWRKKPSFISLVEYEP